MENFSVKGESLIYQTVTVSHDGAIQVTNPCPPSPPSVSKNVDQIDVRVGEVGRYTVYMCAWKLEDLICSEPLKYTLTTLTPSYLGSVPNAFTSSDFSTISLEEQRLRGWINEPNNPFDFGVWRVDVSNYTLSTIGYACEDIYPERINHSTLVYPHSPSISFNPQNSKCGSIQYSDLDNIVGVMGGQNISGCFVSYDVKNPSYDIQYGFLQTISSGARVSMSGENGLNETLEYSVLYLKTSAVNLFDFASGAQKTISQKVKVGSDQDASIGYSFKPSLFTAPYFQRSCDPSDVTSLFNVTRYEDKGTQYYNYLMMKVSPQKGRESYWVPVKESGWYSSYVAVCESPPCGLGLGEAELYTRSWSVTSPFPSAPVSMSFVSSPVWGNSLQESYNVVSMTDFNDMDYWLSCPSSSYPFEEAVSASPPSYGEEL